VGPSLPILNSFVIICIANLCTLCTLNADAEPGNCYDKHKLELKLKVEIPQ